MTYQHKIILNKTRKVIWRFERDIPYLPHEGETVWFPVGWKLGETFKITSVHHYIMEKMIVINVNKSA